MERAPLIDDLSFIVPVPLVYVISARTDYARRMGRNARGGGLHSPFHHDDQMECGRVIILVTILGYLRV